MVVRLVELMCESRHFWNSREGRKGGRTNARITEYENIGVFASRDDGEATRSSPSTIASMRPVSVSTGGDRAALLPYTHRRRCCVSFAACGLHSANADVISSGIVQGAVRGRVC